jgi:membrane glycosyltransferase
LAVAGLARRRGGRAGLWLRRALFFGLTGWWTVEAARWLADIFAADGLSWAELGVLALFVPTFAWISVFFWTAVVGFVLRLTGADRSPLTARLSAEEEAAPLDARTALVMPIRHEDVARVFAGLAAIHRSLAATGHAHAFDLFVLSDSSDPEVCIDEETAWARLRREVDASGSGVCVYYRRRTERGGRKAGNIADFCRRWGRRYDHMVVLDADSVVAGATLVRLTRLMAANPRVALIQTLPFPVNRETLFARVQQFACRLYGPLFATGLAWWQGHESNFWGHNAIIRTAPFIDHCGLPRLPGEAPLGGEILSHDFVEAALLRRAGWEVWFVPELTGSYEELPPSVLDYAERDRRWCQGNLQHARLLGAKGLRPMSRLHLLFGVMSYVASPLWLLLIVMSVAEAVRYTYVPHDYFPEPYSPFPVWPIHKPFETATLFGVTMGVLFLPKFLALILALRDPGTRRASGGALRATQSVLLEIVFSVLLAPLMMLFHTTFVVATVFGAGVGWTSQRRDDRGVTWGEAARRHRWHLLFGVLSAVAVYLAVPDFFWWLTPIFVGLWLAIPLTVLSSRPSLGRAARARGWFLVPEETDPPPELAELRRRLAAEPPQPAAPALAA